MKLHKKKYIKQAIKKINKINNRKDLKPINPIGSCFDSAFDQMFGPKDEPPKDLVLCHGIGITNMPGDEGNTMGHAWIEFTPENMKEKIAFDTTWGVAVLADHYREQLKLDYVVTYNKQEAREMYLKYYYSGPWDNKIKSIMPDRKEQP